MDTEQAVRDITAVLLGIKKQNFQHTKAEQLDETKKEISRERYRKKGTDRSARDTSRSNRWKLPRIECEAESAVKLLHCKRRIEKYLLELAEEISTIKPTVDGDFIRGSNKLTARLSMSRMPYLATKRERKLINGLKQDWNHEEAAINEQTQEILKIAPREIIESESIGIEVENYLKTGVWREQSIEQILNEPPVEEDTDEEEESYYSSEYAAEERENELEQKMEIELSEADRKKYQNRFTLSYFYREWTMAHADLQLIRIAMELCRPDTRAYAEQMMFIRGRATHVVDAANQDMTFLHGRECNEEAIQAMLYVISLQGMVARLNTHPQDEMIETVRIKMDGEEKVVPLTFDLIKLIAAEKVLLCPDYPWYQCLPVDGYGPEVEEKLLDEVLSIETGEDAWVKRGPDARPLSGIHEYQTHSSESILQSVPIKDVYVNSKTRNPMIQESAERVKDEQCLTTPSEILVAGVGVLLSRVCAFESAVITRFEQEIENLPEKQRMVLRQLYMEGRNFRELTDSSGKPLSKNSSSRWNKRGLRTIQERMEEKPLSIRG